LGIKAENIFTYDGINIKLRPLSSYEIDLAERKGYAFVTPSLAKLIMRIRLRDVALVKELKAIPPDMFVSIQDYYKEIDYHICYYSMKDFQPDDFSIDDIRKMKFVHDIAQKVLGMSSATDKSIIEVINSLDGSLLGNVIFNYNVPITDEAWKVTPLQYRFLELSSGNTKPLTKEEFEQQVYGTKIDEVLKKLVGK